MQLAHDDSSVRLTIARYQFPDIADDDWLIIDGVVRLSGREWRFRDPCLMTHEVARLADWLEACVRGDAERPYCGFIEPNLQFDLVDPATLRIGFALESAPPWAKEVGDHGSVHGFNLPVGPALVEAAEDLRRQLGVFPPRGLDED